MRQGVPGCSRLAEVLQACCGCHSRQAAIMIAWQTRKDLYIASLDLSGTCHRTQYRCKVERWGAVSCFHFIGCVCVHAPLSPFISACIKSCMLLFATQVNILRLVAQDLSKKAAMQRRKEEGAVLASLWAVGSELNRGCCLAWGPSNMLMRLPGTACPRSVLYDGTHHSRTLMEP